MGKISQEEVEIKLRVPNLAALRRQLRQLGAQRQGRVNERNTLFDTADRALMRSGRLLRLRWNNSKAILTFKKPVRRPRGKPRRYKTREEIEFAVLQPGKVTAVLEGLGFIAGFRYEKVRTTYILNRVKGVKIEVDETPIGVYVELEGSGQGIDRVARLLGYGPEDYITSNYFTLFRESCRGKGKSERDMLFPAHKGRRD